MGVSKRWQLLTEHRELSQTISSKLQCSPVVSQVLLNRGFRSLTDITTFIHGGTEKKETFDSADMDKAITLIDECISQKKPILVYGDYDVDGMTSIAICVTLLKELGASVQYFVPHRFREGYGLHYSVVEMIKTHEIGLLITL